jgi:hypothetical protein
MIFLNFQKPIKVLNNRVIVYRELDWENGWRRSVCGFFLRDAVKYNRKYI